MKENKCQAYLPPSCSKQCFQPTTCGDFCLSHCLTKHYPNSHLLRCPNPKHPFVALPPPKPETSWYTNNADLSGLSKAKLKNRIEKDLELLAELKQEVEGSYLPSPDDPETWDADD